MVTVDRDSVVAALAAEWRAIAELCAALSDAEWAAPTDCPGWSVQDNVSHITGTERMLLGDPVPEVDIGEAPHVHNEIGRINELWIAARRASSPAAVLEEFREVTARRLAALAAMTQADFDAESWTPAGTDTYGRFMRIRTLDCWVHEQDIRGAVDRPGHVSGPVVEMVLDEFAFAVGFAVAKLGRAPDGSRVLIDLTGPAARSWHVQVTDRRGRLVESFDGAAGPTITLRTDAHTYPRLAGGRIAGDAALSAGLVSLEGDLEAAERILAGLGYMP
ncbi:MAG: maleylpyruvate isomerase family mycothiol-dependent enzyme [bacterium]|nr:maleylpyruvate isomerase family mycothiol-dependent enzyme [bacterium]